MMNTNDFLNFLDILSAGFDIRGDVVDTTELINNKHFITIDTCYTNDTGRYELVLRQIVINGLSLKAILIEHLL